ncbi:ribonuclease 3 [Geotalea uraniireducens]|uniref:Ribonuclease 3 n=1 Tax=Geotalea uraniireducens TaxID=351604 RepID=A0ABM8EJQ3_9BACT|nr:ribonuclease III [Geotalea uraniireducens]BDV42571.1 ribonuclease 3 [Geotalea uraniireducens]
MNETGKKEADSSAADNSAGLEAVIGYRFANRPLLDEALTHRSFANEARGQGVADNERLEFFGDAVLGFCVGKLLLDRYPGRREGVLARMKAALVGEELLAELAATIGLGRFLRLGRGEERSGGRERKSLLANAYEALLAAVYLDGGLEPVERLVREAFGPRLADVASGVAGRDFKTEFQEYVQTLYGAPPVYILTATDGPPHERRFTVKAFVGNEPVGEGQGRSKKEAEQAAARAGLELLATSRRTAAE